MPSSEIARPCTCPCAAMSAWVWASESNRSPSAVLMPWAVSEAPG